MLCLRLMISSTYKTNSSGLLFAAGRQKEPFSLPPIGLGEEAGNNGIGNGQPLLGKGKLIAL